MALKRFELDSLDKKRTRKSRNFYPTIIKPLRSKSDAWLVGDRRHRLGNQATVGELHRRVEDGFLDGRRLNRFDCVGYIETTKMRRMNSATIP